MAICIECESDLEVDEDVLEIGEIIVCRECGSELEVLRLGPLELGRGPEEEDDEEDWGDDGASP